MTATDVSVASPGQSIFVSYSRSDKHRISGLGLLLEALGHRVFIDHKSILPGSRWQASLQDGLEQAEVLLVFWTRQAARADWVRKEVEYFHIHFPERMLVPVLGDETPLSELLAARQHADFAPLINELLEMKRNLEKAGAKSQEIQESVLNRLREAGIEVTHKDRKRLFGLFAPAGLLGLAATPLAFLRWFANSSLEATAQLSTAQSVLLAAAALSGAVVCGVTEHVSADRQTGLEPDNRVQQPQTNGKPVAPGFNRQQNSSSQNISPQGTQESQVRDDAGGSQPMGFNRGESINDCERIDCDCKNLDFGLLTGPYRDECRNAEAALRKTCAQTGEVTGSCHPTASGPNPWPG